MEKEKKTFVFNLLKIEHNYIKQQVKIVNHILKYLHYTCFKLFVLCIYQF